MLRFIPRLFVVVAIILASCTNRNGQGSQSKNDTVTAIELAVKTALVEDFPEMEPVKRKNGDSIFITSNLLSLSHLPQKIDSFRFKILPDTLICAAIKTDTLSHKTDTLSQVLPNYLKVSSFEKRDTGYFVQLESLSCPAGGEGGSVGIFIVKSKDTFIFKKK
jgi:hypothetical protein